MLLKALFDEQNKKGCRLAIASMVTFVFFFVLIFVAFYFAHLEIDVDTDQRISVWELQQEVNEPPAIPERMGNLITPGALAETVERSDLSPVIADRLTAVDVCVPAAGLMAGISTFCGVKAIHTVEVVEENKDKRFFANKFNALWLVAYVVFIVLMISSVYIQDFSGALASYLGGLIVTLGFIFVGFKIRDRIQWSLPKPVQTDAKKVDAAKSAENPDLSAGESQAAPGDTPPAAPTNATPPPPPPPAAPKVTVPGPPPAKEATPDPERSLSRKSDGEQKKEESQGPTAIRRRMAHEPMCKLLRDIQK